MGLETGNYIYDLVQSNPPAGDQRKEGDDHLRLIKKVLQQTFPHITGPTLPVSTGTANAQLVTHLFGPPAYLPGQIVPFVAGFTNTGAMTLAVNGGAAKNFYIGGAPVGAGNVVAGGLYLAMYDGVQFQMAGAFGVSGYLPLTGGTLTGLLTINGNNLVIDNAAGTSRLIQARTAGSTRWNLTLANSVAESGSNAGSDFQIIRCSDAGAVIDTPLTISRASGLASFGGAVAVNNSGGLSVNASSSIGLTINGAAASQRTLAFLSNSSQRWQIMTEQTAEGGANAGSNLTINRWSDAGAFLGSPISIARSTGVTSFSAAIVNGPSDRSLKENIRPLDGALNKIMALKGVSFNFIKDKAKRQIGLIAQDVAPIVPEVMQDFQDFDAEGKATEPKLAIDYTRLVPVLIEAIKELTAKVTSLEERLEAAGA